MKKRILLFAVSLISFVSSVFCFFYPFFAVSALLHHFHYQYGS